MNFNIFKKNFTAKKYCDFFYKFPNGTKIYKLKDDYFEKLPANKLLSIQENSNYIAFLGISKNNLESAHNKLDRQNAEIRALVEGKYLKEKVLEKIDAQAQTIKAINLSQSEYDNTFQTILLSVFDMFFYFEKEPLFTQDNNYTELKRDYMNKYPLLRGFFFKSLENYLTDLKITFNNAINLAVAQTSIQELIKQLSHTNIPNDKIN